MCSWIVEKSKMAGMAKGPEGWFDVQQANVYYDHPFSAPMDHALIIDFVNNPDQAGNRVSVELSKESAERLIESIQAALATGEEAHA